MKALSIIGSIDLILAALYFWSYFSGYSRYPIAYLVLGCLCFCAGIFVLVIALKPHRKQRERSK